MDDHAVVIDMIGINIIQSPIQLFFVGVSRKNDHLISYKLRYIVGF